MGNSSSILKKVHEFEKNHKNLKYFMDLKTFMHLSKSSQIWIKVHGFENIHAFDKKFTDLDKRFMDLKKVC